MAKRLMFSELEMQELPWLTVEERIWIERLLEMGILECIYHEKPVHPPWEHPEDRPFNTIVRDRFSGSPSTFEELHNHSSL